MGENAASTLTKGMRVIVSGRLEQREYQNREGEKRTAIEINADEIGPSLRWATASVERIPRGEGGGNGGGFSGGNRGGNAGGGNSGGNAGGGDYFPADEEPF
jgi:single-strand DNA-binding protein